MLQLRPPHLSRPVRMGLFVLPVALLAGCVHQESSGSTATFRYEYWVPLVTFLGGAVAAPLGWVLRQRSTRLGWTFLIGGPIAALGFAPSLLGEKVVVDAEHFHVQTGVWGMTSVHDVKFANLQSVKLTSEVSTGRRGRKSTNYFFLCEMKSGATIKVPMNNKVAEAAAAPIVMQVMAHGIPIVDESEPK